MFESPLHHTLVMSSPAERVLWPVWSALFVLALWASLWDLRFTAQLFAGLSVPVQESKVTASAPQLLQMLSRISQQQVWLLGRIAERLDGGLDNATETAAVDEAACILLNSQAAHEATLSDLTLFNSTCPFGSAAQYLPVLSAQTLRNLGQLLGSRQSGSLSRLESMVSLANVIWVLGAVGVAIAFFPAVSPMLNHLWALLGPFMTAVRKYLRPLFGLAIYSTSWFIIAYATRCSQQSAAYMAFTGCFLALATYIYSGTRQASLDTPEWMEDAFRTSIYLFAFVTFTPLAAAYRSVLLGFGTSASVFALLGFFVVPFGLGFRIGWSSHETMLQTGAAAAALTVLQLAIRTCRYMAPSWPSLLYVDRLARPFYPGLAVFGSICLFLCGLIWSSRFYYKDTHYRMLNLLTLAALLVVTAAGALLQDGTFQNTGITFLVLWGLQKLLEAPGMSTWVAVLLGSGALVAAGSFLKAHPLWVLTMLGASKPAVVSAVAAGL